MKALLKVIVTCLVLLSLTLPALGCSSGNGEENTVGSETTTVQRGNLTLEITSVGNLDLSRTEELTFDLFYQEGTVEEILVEAGDTVEEGEVLAKLDEDEWDSELKTLRDAVTTAERAVTTKERALATAERAVYTKELAVTAANLTLQSAENTLKANSNIYKYYKAIDDIKYDIRIASELGQFYLIDNGTNDDLNSQLAAAQSSLSEILYKSSLTTSTSSAAELALAQAIQTYNEKGKLLGDAIIAVEDARIAIEDAQVALDDVNEDLEEAQEDYDEANAKGSYITAPFNGFITRVSVEGGDEIMRGTVAIEIADPDQFEAEIMVSEMDIMQVGIGDTAWIEVDALDGLSLPAEVTHVSPTASISSGVVNYAVKVEIMSSANITRQRQGAREGAMADFSSGEMPEPMKQAIADGRITEEQAEEIMERIQSGEMPFGESGTGGPESGSSGQLPTMVPEDYQLKEGMTVTVNLIVSEAINVLLVPSAAITAQGNQSFVQVVTGNGTDGELITEQRAIETGITDYQFTEVTSGLGEGETILVPQGTATTVTSQGRRQGGVFFMGGPR